jgi:hypothetical protein
MIMGKLNIDDLELFELIIDEDDNTEGVFSNSLVSSPAIERGFVWLSSQEIKLESVDTDKRLVAGPILIPNKKILRQDEVGSPYTIFFTPETIEKMSRKFMKNKYTSEMTIEHGRKKVDGIYLTESWLIESPSKDKSNLYGFTLPAGTWFGIYKIDNDAVWEQVKSGDVKGFSVEMIADHIPSTLKPSKLFSKEIVDLTEVEAEIVFNKIKDLIFKLEVGVPHYTADDIISQTFFEKGLPHYTADGKLYEGPTHKDAEGRLMTGEVHTEDSEYLYHKEELEGEPSIQSSYPGQIQSGSNE